MFKLLLIFSLLVQLSTVIIAKNSDSFANNKSIAIFTDYEADDAVGIAALLKYFQEQGITSGQFLFGISLSNQYRKKALVQKIVTLFGYDGANVFAGTGGIKEPFEQEGRNILPQHDLQKFLDMDKTYFVSKDPHDHSDPELSVHFGNFLQRAKPHSVDILLLTNPIDFVRTIQAHADSFSKINTIYMMGGWYGNKPSFNWGLHIESVKQLLQLMERAQREPESPQLVLFSSHFFAREFNGYVNASKFPAVIKAFDHNKSPVVTHLRHMVQNWDASMTEIKPEHEESERKWRQEMIERIGKENIGRQFAPADPATALGYLYPQKFITKQTPVKIKLRACDANNTYTVDVQEDAASNVFLVEQVDLQFFNEKLVELMSAAL